MIGRSQIGARDTGKKSAREKPHGEKDQIHDRMVSLNRELNFHANIKPRAVSVRDITRMLSSERITLGNEREKPAVGAKRQKE